MLTLFAVPKPFRGHIAVIQRNAIQSWLQLRPACEIILFGDDEGTAEIAAEFGVRHVPAVARNEYGTPLLDSMFETAQRVASHELMAYVNADIILMRDFIAAVGRVRKRRFLMVGRRWDLDVDEPLDFSTADWEAQLRPRVVAEGKPHTHWGIDYFVFPKGLWGEIPPFAIGRTMWDNWLLYRARSLGVAVIDATAVVTPVHQNHGYTRQLQRADGAWDWQEAEVSRNLELAGGHEYAFNIQDATWILARRGLWPALSHAHIRQHLERLPVLYPRPGFRAWALRQSLSLGLANHYWLPRFRPRRLMPAVVRRARRLFQSLA